MYAKYIKRILDIAVSLIALLILLPILLLLALAGAIAMGGNPFFVQLRPGKDEKIFRLIKFRSMNNRKDKKGNLLPDDMRLNKYGRILRATSLDELPELLNILKGDMSIVGPRPQLVRDMVFMTPQQRRRHTVRQGLTGLAQVMGRNNISWEEKIEWDLRYIDGGISFKSDLKIIFLSVKKVLCREDIATDGMETAEDLGDYLHRTQQVSSEEYDRKQALAKELLSRAG